MRSQSSRNQAHADNRTNYAVPNCCITGINSATYYCSIVAQTSRIQKKTLINSRLTFRLLKNGSASQYPRRSTLPAAPMVKTYSSGTRDSRNEREETNKMFSRDFRVNTSISSNIVNASKELVNLARRLVNYRYRRNRRRAP